jgi:hypothetical protein
MFNRKSAPSPEPMLRFFIRILGLLLLAGGFSALVVDGTRTIAGGSPVVTTLLESATQLFPQRLEAYQAWVEQRLGAWGWDPAMILLLHLPVSVTLGGLGAALILLSRKQEEPIGYLVR